MALWLYISKPQPNVHLRPKEALLLELLEKAAGPVDTDELAESSEYTKKGVYGTLYDLQKNYGVVKCVGQFKHSTSQVSIRLLTPEEEQMSRMKVANQFRDTWWKMSSTL